MPHAPSALVQVPALLQVLVIFRVQVQLIRLYSDISSEMIYNLVPTRERSFMKQKKQKVMVYILNTYANNSLRACQKIIG